MMNQKFLKFGIFALIILAVACKKDDPVEEDSPQKSPLDCIPNNLQDGIIAFYPFANGTLDDLSSNDNHLSNTTTAHPTTDRFGNDSCAYIFDNIPAAGEFLTMANPVFLDGLDNFSVSLWYQPKDSARDGGVSEVLLARDEGYSCPNRYGQWSINLYDCRRAVFGRLNSVWDNFVSDPFVSCDEEVNQRTGVWAHIAATYDGTSMEMKIYRDGVLQETDSGVAQCSPLPEVFDVGDLFLGVDYTGKLDDIIIYNKTLSQAEVDVLNTMEACCEE